MRVGTVIASNRKALQSWNSYLRRKRGAAPSLRGAALEAAVMQIAQMFPGHVIHQQAAA